MEETITGAQHWWYTRAMHAPARRRGRAQASRRASQTTGPPCRLSPACKHTLNLRPSTQRAAARMLTRRRQCEMATLLRRSSAGVGSLHSHLHTRKPVRGRSGGSRSGARQAGRAGGRAAVPTGRGRLAAARLPTPARSRFALGGCHTHRSSALPAAPTS